MEKEMVINYLDLVNTVKYVLEKNFKEILEVGVEDYKDATEEENDIRYLYYSASVCWHQLNKRKSEIAELFENHKFVEPCH